MSPFVRRRSLSVAAWGEERLIRGIAAWLGKAGPPPPAGIGDDCAVLPPARRAGREVRLLKVDPVVFGKHFDRRLRPEAAGEKLLKRNLSDIAAMGGAPAAAVVGLVLSADVGIGWLRRFYRGLARAALRYRVRVVGGDVAQSPRSAGSFFAAQLMLAGTLPAGRPALRSGARVGDALYVTGELGNSFRSGHHARFEPRLKEGAWLAGRGEVRAMMDLSDGLAKDLPALAPRGGAPAVMAAALPRRKGADLKSALAEGEDYELLVAARGLKPVDAKPSRTGPGNAESKNAAMGGAETGGAGKDAGLAAFEAAFRHRFPRTPLTRIGYFARASAELPEGAVDFSALRGYEHFR